MSLEELREAVSSKVMELTEEECSEILEFISRLNVSESYPSPSA